jgi:hypothetical protein
MSTSADRMTVGEIYDLLVSGSKVGLVFDNETQFTTFRSKLYNHKSETEPAMITLELIQEPQSLSVIRNMAKPDEFAYIFKLVPKISRISTYEVEIIDDDEVPLCLKD